MESSHGPAVSQAESDFRFEISDLRFEIQNLKSAIPRPAPHFARALSAAFQNSFPTGVE